MILHWNNGINCLSWIKIIGICMIAWSLFECENNKNRNKKSVNYMFDSWLFVFYECNWVNCFQWLCFLQFISQNSIYRRMAKHTMHNALYMFVMGLSVPWLLIFIHPKYQYIAWFISIYLLSCDLMHVFVRLIASIQFVCEMENIVLWVTFFTCSPFYHHSFFKLIVKF